MIKHKISIILSISFLSLLLLSTIILSIFQTNTKPNLPNPDEINIYNKSISSTTSYKQGTEQYNEILKHYNAMFEKTYLSQLKDQEILNSTIKEDTIATPWNDVNFETGLYVEFKFEKAKKFIIYRNGNSRQVNISSLIFKVSNSNKSDLLYVYYKIPTVKSESNSNKEEPQILEPCYPLITQANTSNLYKYIISND